MTISIEPANAGHFAAMDKVRSGKSVSTAKPRSKRGNDHHEQTPISGRNEICRHPTASWGPG
jgi:hypothetical protein